MANVSNELTPETVRQATAVPVTDVGVTYDHRDLTLTLPGFLDRAAVVRLLARMNKGVLPFKYRRHYWRNQLVQSGQRDL